MKCPVCDKIIKTKYSFCERCGWLHLPSTENEDKVLYEKRLKIAMKNWKVIQKFLELKKQNKIKDKIQQKPLKEKNREDNDIMKDCPFCAERIRITAIKCRSCGNMLEGNQKPATLSSPRPRRFIPSKKITNSVGMQFVLIPAGTFMMGSPTDEKGRGNDETQHRVTISTRFYMQTTPVTQGQWKAVMGGRNPSHFKNDDSLPVERVSYGDIQKFIRKLNKNEGTDKYRLPTESEWEYACRAGSEGARYGILNEIAWYYDNSSQTRPVGQKKSNAWGLYDMLGNVFEWVQDWYGTYPVDHVKDPNGSSEAFYKTFRGGFNGSEAKFCRAASRGSDTMDRRSNALGFRLVRIY